MKLYQTFLGFISILVPAAVREEWLREWQAELHWQYSQGPSPILILARLLGALPDAVILRIQHWNLPMLIQDLKFATRRLVSQPAFTLTATLTLALGIGALTAVFSICYSVLVEPLPFQDPDRLIVIWEQNPERGWYQETAAPANFYDWKARSKTVKMMGASSWRPSLKPLTIRGETEMVKAHSVTGDFFTVFGVPAYLGRTFSRDETWSTSEAVAVLSYTSWQRRFGGKPDTLGDSVRLGDQEYRIVGVMPASFSIPGVETEFWVPFRWNPEVQSQVFFRRAHWIRVFGRLGPGVSLKEAEAELQTIASQLAHEYPDTNRLMGNGITPIHDWFLGDTRRPVYLLLVAAGLLLTIACFNVANLLLARGLDREREMGIRAVLGASRSTLIRQMMVECLMLGILGGGLGILTANWGIRLLIAASPQDLVRFSSAGLKPEVLLFALIITMLTVLAFGMVPAVRAASPSQRNLKARGTSTSRRSARGTRGLTVIQVGVAVCVVISAGLIVRTYHELEEEHPGFRVKDVATLRLRLPESYADSGPILGFASKLLPALEQLPQVERSGITRQLPLVGHSWTSDFSVEGRPEPETGAEIIHRESTPGYFEVMNLPLISGALPPETLDPGTPPVLVINRAMADRYFRDEDPVGRRIAFTSDPSPESTWWRISAVVGSEKQEGLRQAARPEVYEHFFQSSRRDLTLVLKTRPDSSGLLAAIKATVSNLDAEVPVYDFKWMEEVFASTLDRERFLLQLMAAFSLASFALAVIGIYGVVSQSANRRVREIGIRIAVGATRSQIRRLILAQGAYLIGGGLSLGLLAALVVTRYLEGFLFEISTLDPMTYVTVSALFFLVGLAASLFPALRASRLNPVESIRVSSQ